MRKQRTGSQSAGLINEVNRGAQKRRGKGQWGGKTEKGKGGVNLSLPRGRSGAHIDRKSPVHVIMTVLGLTPSWRGMRQGTMERISQGAAGEITSSKKKRRESSSHKQAWGETYLGRGRVIAETQSSGTGICQGEIKRSDDADQRRISKNKNGPR